MGRAEQALNRPGSGRARPLQKAMSTREKPINKKAMGRLHEKADRILGAAMCEGFHGSVHLEAVLVDGIIRNLRTRIEEQEIVGRE